MKTKPAFMNFTVDHMTLLFHPSLYPIAYAVFRIILGTTPDDLLYEKRRPGKNGEKDKSMTFATCVGKWTAEEKEPLPTIFAIVQPTEPAAEPSHVREMLQGLERHAHLQHIALRTPDLISFHKHCVERGVQFVTPILKDDHENLIQVFSAEWFLPGGRPSGLFFEFVQRDPSSDELAEIQKANKQSWFRDETFLGLYDEKEREYQSGKVKSFVTEKAFNRISERLAGKQVFEITEDDLADVERIMIATAKEEQA
jgi:hypothetical protein